jgi:hypothetical protein
LKFWKVEPDWRGQDAVIICGGTSVTPALIDLASRCGKHTIVINSVYQFAPWAELLFFADMRWWDQERKLRRDLIRAWPGQIATTSRKSKGDHLLRLRKMTEPPYISDNPEAAFVHRSSLTGALNICYHRRARRVIILGADNSESNGRAHFHEEYIWSRVPGTWEAKAKELEGAARILARAGVEVVNCSPISTLTCWPKAEAATALLSA